MTLKEFRSNKDLVEYAQAIFSQKKFRLLLEAVRNEHPKNYRPATRGLAEHDHAINLGRVYGYDEFDNNLMVAATLEIPSDQPLVPTFTPLTVENDK